MNLANSSIIDLENSLNLGVLEITNDTWLWDINPATGATCFGTEGNTLLSIMTPLVDPSEETDSI
jgi:hypothetical protein